MTTRRRRKAEPATDTTTYQSLWEGDAEDDHNLPRGLRQIFAVIDDHRAADAWITYGATSADNPTDPPGLGRPPRRRHLRCGWDQEGNRTAAFNGRPFIPRDSHGAARSIVEAVVSYSLTENLLYNAGETDGAPCLRTTARHHIHLRNPQGERDRGAERYGIVTELTRDDLPGRSWLVKLYPHAIARRKTREPPMLEDHMIEVPTNRRTRECIRWLVTAARALFRLQPNDNPMTEVEKREIDWDVAIDTIMAEAEREQGGRGGDVPETIKRAVQRNSPRLNAEADDITERETHPVDDIAVFTQLDGGQRNNPGYGETVSKAGSAPYPAGQLRRTLEQILAAIVCKLSTDHAQLAPAPTDDRSPHMRARAAGQTVRAIRETAARIADTEIARYLKGQGDTARESAPGPSEPESASDGAADTTEAQAARSEAANAETQPAERPIARKDAKGETVH